jgi:hypothetical protein
MEEQELKNDKIFYIDIGADDKVANNDNCFVEFISYLYHSELQIKIVDAISNI